MKPLADEILDLLQTCDGLSARQVMATLSVEHRHALAAFHALNEAGRAGLVCVGRELIAVSNSKRIGESTCICVVCRDSFALPKKSKRRTCSRACHASLGWRDPAVRARRVASIVEAKNSSEMHAVTAEVNRKRWAKPGERERLAEQNRKRWKDPATAAKMSRGIRAHHQTPEYRKLSAEIRKAFWDDPEGRQRMIAGIKAAHGSPEARARFSERLRQRWQDPVLREKYIAANRARARTGGIASAKKRWGRKEAAEVTS